MKKVFRKRLLFLSLIIFFSSCKCCVNEVIVFHQPVGWGYKIKYQKKIIIIQQNIPAVNGNFAFRSKKDAKKTGSLALIKMIKNPKRFPEINTKELDSLGISYE